MKITLGNKKLFKIERGIPFVLGVIGANNIAYAFVIGNTSIKIFNLFTVLIVAVSLLNNQNRVFESIRLLPYSLKFWFVCIGLSIVPLLCFHPQFAYQWLVGCIDVILNVSIIITIIMYRECLGAIISGISFGLALNVLRVCYEFVMYKSGVIVNLASVFPNETIVHNYIGNPFRGMGFFCEPGHLMRFTIIFSLLVLNYHKTISRKKYWIMIACILTVFLSTLSSSLAIFGVGFLLYSLLSTKITNKRILYSVLGIGLIIPLMIGLYKTNAFFFDMLNRLSDSFLSIFALDISNTVRTTGMRFAVNLIKKYSFIGSGWNTITTLFKQNGYYLYNAGGPVTGSYSYALSLLLMLGLGAIPYFIFFVENAIKNIKCKDLLSLSIGVSVLMALMLTISTDFSFNSNSCLLIGIAIANLINRRNIQI